MNSPLRDWIPVLLFIGATYNGIMLTIFALMFADVRERLIRLEDK